MSPLGLSVLNPVRVSECVLEEGCDGGGWVRDKRLGRGVAGAF